MPVMCAPGGAPGTPSTRSLDPSWGDSDQGGVPEEGTAKGGCEAHLGEGR